MANETLFKNSATTSHHGEHNPGALSECSRADDREAPYISECGPLSSTPIPIMWSLSDSSDTEDLSISSVAEDEELAKYMDLHSLNVYRRACTKLDCMKEGDELKDSIEN